MSVNLDHLLHDPDEDIVDTVAIIVAQDHLHEEDDGRHDGSRPGSSPNVLRDFSGGYRRIMLDYFWDEVRMRDD